MARGTFCDVGGGEVWFEEEYPGGFGGLGPGPLRVLRLMLARRGDEAEADAVEVVTVGVSRLGVEVGFSGLAPLVCPRVLGEYVSS